MNPDDTRIERSGRRPSVGSLALAACLAATAAGCTTQRPVSTIFAEVSVSSAVAYRLPITARTDRSAEIEFYEQRARRNPTGGLDLADLAGAYLARAKQEHDHQWLVRAEEAARQSLANLDIGNIKADLVLALIAQERHDFAGALVIARKILAQRPRHVGALSVATTSHLARGELFAAQAAADAWVTEEPGQVALSHRAIIADARGRDGAALADFATALAAEQPGETEASSWTRTMLARFHLRRGRLIAARAAIDEARRIAPSAALPLAVLAELEARSGDTGEAQRHYLALHQATGQPMWLAELAAVVAASGQRARARALWRTAIDQMRADLAHGHDDHRRHLASALLARGDASDIPEALALAERDAAGRRDAETVLCYSKALARAGRADAAMEVVAEALVAGLDDARLHEQALALGR